MELMKKLNTGELWAASSDELSSTFASGGIPHMAWASAARLRVSSLRTPAHNRATQLPTSQQGPRSRLPWLRAGRRSRPAPLGAGSQPWRGGDSQQPRGQLRQPPVPATEQGDDRGNEQRSDDRRVQEDPRRQAGRQHFDFRLRPRRERDEREEQDQG